MAYKLLKVGVQANSQTKEYVVDSADDISNLPSTDPFGSTAFVIETSETYMKSSSGEYVVLSTGGGGVTPTGTKVITKNGIEDVSEYANVDVRVPQTTDPEKGIIFDNYDEYGYPTTARVVGEWSGEFPTFRECFGTNTAYLRKISSFVVPNGVTVLGGAAFYNCTNLQTITLPTTLTTIKGQYNFYNVVCDIVVPDSFSTWESNSQFAYCKSKKIIFLGNVPDIPNACFASVTNVELYDFSHCIKIPSLYSVASFSYKNGCTVRIPYELSDEALGTGNGWESALNWDALTNIVWEVV